MEWVYRLYLNLHGATPLNVGKRLISPEQQILFLIALFGSISTVVLTRWMITHFLGKDTPLRWVSMAVIYMLCAHELLVPDIRAQFPYDVTTGLFFGAGLFAAAFGNRWVYYPALLIGTFNRETTMFLPIAFVIASLPQDVPLRRAWRQIRLAIMAEAIGQIVAWQLIVKLCERLTGGHGTGVKITWQSNLFIMANPTHWPLFLSIFGFLWIPLVIYFRRIQNISFRRFGLLLPLWWIVMFYVGDPLEIRLYNEWIPYTTVCLALILSQSIVFQTKGISPGTVS